MSEAQRQHPTYVNSHLTEDPRPTAWAAWIIFAGIMLILVGSFQAIAGLMALLQHTYYAVRPEKLAVHLGYTGWGWLHLSLGVAAAFAGFGMMVGKMWARVYAVVLAGISAIVNLGFLSAYPLWATMMIAIDVLVIYALTVHGRDVDG